MRPCLRLVEDKSWEDAVLLCEQAFAESSDPRAGAAAAEAHLALHNDDAVLAWLERLEDSSEAARLWRMAAKVYSRRREDERAAEGYRKALELSREAGDHQEAARNLYSLFYLAWRQSDFRQALKSAQAAAEEAALARDRAMEAKVLRGMLALRYDLGDLPGAWRTLEAARAAVGPEESSVRARLLVYEGTFRLSEGRFALARDALERALEEATGEEEASFFRSIHLNLVEANVELGEAERAERHLAAAWEHADPKDEKPTALLYYQAVVQHALGRHDEAAEALRSALGEETIPDWTWRLEHLLGQVEEARGFRAQAEAAQERAVRVVEEMRGELGYDELKDWLLDGKRQPYEELFRLRVADGRFEDALATVERAKARTFLDAFIQASAALDPDAALDAAPQRLEALHELLPLMNESPMVALRPLDQMLEALRDRHLLVYFEAGDELWLISVARGRVVPRRVAAVAEVEALSSRFLADPGEASAGEALGRLLLPDDALPAPGTRLYIVADAHLGRLPFAALRCRGRYLVEDYELLYVPGANALVALDERPRDAAGAPYVLGDPRGDLPGARREVGEVAARWEGTTARSGGEATVASLREAAQARLLHLATHTGGGPRGPWLALADGEVSAAEIVAERIAPRLVVLASCAAADRPGKGMWGSLGAAFLVAGSRSVLASLGSVEDEAGRRFILRFYDEGGDTDPAGALARTQRAFLAEGAGPRLWASFVLFGAPR